MQMTIIKSDKLSN